MTLRQTAFAALLAVFSALPLRAADFTCPDEIAPSQTMTAPAGWKIFMDKTNTHALLTRIDLYDGAPEEMAQLEPDNGDDDEGESDDMGAEVWTLGKSKRPIYMVCVYTDTAVRLTKALPAGLKNCRVIEKNDDAVRASKGNTLIDKLTCQ